MIRLYYNPKDGGDEDTANTNNKTFSHIDSIGFGLQTQTAAS
jgi:hypothetical protein